MPISMYTASVPLFLRTLNSMLDWLDKAEDYAKTRGFDPQNYLALRMAPDMMPFSRQIQITTDSAKNCVARLSGVEPPTWEDDEDSLDELRARLRKAIAYLESVSPEQIDGSEEREVVMPAGPDQTIAFAGQAFLTGFSLPNFYFHATMTYALLRHAGVEIGKMDYLGALDIQSTS